MLAKPFTVFLQDTGDLDDAGMVETLSQIITKQLEPVLIFRNFYRPDRYLMRRGGNTRRYPSKRAVVAHAFAEDEDVPFATSIDGDALPTTIKRSFVEVTVTKYGARDEITGEAIDDADFAIIRDVRESLVDAMRRFHDDKALIALMNQTLVDPGQVVTPTVGTDGFGDSVKGEAAAGTNTFAFEAAPFEHRHVIECVSVYWSDGGAPVLLSPNLDYRIDYMDGIVQIPDGGSNGLANPSGATYGSGETLTIVYTYVDAVAPGVGVHNPDFSQANFLEAITAQSFEWRDAIRMRARIKGKNGQADSLVTDSVTNVLLLEDQRFLTGGQLGENILRNGEIGRVAGMGMFETTQAPQVPTALWSMNIGWETIKEEMRFKMEDIAIRINDQRLMFEARNAFAITRPEVISFLFNAQDSAVKAPAA